MSEQLLQKILEIIDMDLKEVDRQLLWMKRIQEKESDLLIEKLELLRARKEVEKGLEDLQSDKESKEKTKEKIQPHFQKEDPNSL